MVSFPAQFVTPLRVPFRSEQSGSSGWGGGGEREECEHNLVHVNKEKMLTKNGLTGRNSEKQPCHQPFFASLSFLIACKKFKGVKTFFSSFFPSPDFATFFPWSLVEVGGTLSWGGGGGAGGGGGGGVLIRVAITWAGRGVLKDCLGRKKKTALKTDPSLSPCIFSVLCPRSVPLRRSRRLRRGCARRWRGRLSRSR